MSEAQAPPLAVDADQEHEVESCVDRLKRERADFLNYKHRVEGERAADRERERMDLLRELVPAIDDLDRALEHTTPDLVGHPWARGISLARERQYMRQSCTGNSRRPKTNTSTACCDPAIDSEHNFSDQPRWW